MNSKVIAALAAALGGAGGVVVGALVRQPEINKLHKQVKRLQANIDGLQAVIDEQNSEIAELFFKYKQLKVYQFTKRRELKGNIQESLIYQYAAADYLALLLGFIETEGEMRTDDIEFYRSFGKVLDDKKASESEKEAINSYVWGRHRAELESLTPCNIQPVLERVRDFEKEEKPKRPGLFRRGENEVEETPLELIAPDQAAVSELRQAFFEWADMSDRKLSDMQEILECAGYRLLSKRSASLSGLNDYPASEKLEAGTVLSAAVGSGRQSIIFADSSADPVGYISGSRGYAADVVELIAAGGCVYGIVERRDSGKTGKRNRVHLILAEKKPL